MKRLIIEIISMIALSFLFAYTIVGYLPHDPDCLCHICEVRYYEQRESGK